MSRRTVVLGSIRLENLSDCLIYLSPCCTSCYLENCVNCVICIASHQLRIHKTINSHLYVKCNSHPIIEDCSQLGFAPYDILSYNLDTNNSKVLLMEQHLEVHRK